MNTHIELLICCLTRAASYGDLLRGVRRSRLLAKRHGVSWRMVKASAFGAVRSARCGVRSAA